MLNKRTLKKSVELLTLTLTLVAGLELNQAHAQVAVGSANGSNTVPASSSVADLLPFEEGSYKGRFREGHSNETIHMMVRAIPGRRGSFLTVIFRKDEVVNLYRADPQPTNAQYSLTRLSVSRDGEIAVNNDQPSLVLTLVNISDPSRPEFSIENSNSGNTEGYQGSMVFKGRSSHYEWLDEPISGRYKLPAVERQAADVGVSLPQAGDPSQEVSITLRVNTKLSGNYNLREKIPGFYTLKPVATMNVGAIEREHPSYIGFFVKGCLGSKHLLLVNPSDSKDVFSLTRQTFQK